MEEVPEGMTAIKPVSKHPLIMSGAASKRLD
jgi:hypothetical protein